MGKKKKQIDVTAFGVPSLAPTVEMKPGASATVIPERYTTTEDTAVAQRAEEQRREDLDWSDLPKQAIQSNWMVPSVSRFLERNDYSPSIEGYKVPEEELDLLPHKMEDKSYLRESTSPEDYKRRLVYLDEDLERKRGLASYGWQGAAAGFLAELFDPVGWGIGAIGAPQIAAMKGGRLLKAGAGALTFGTQGAATEALLAAGDTQKPVSDAMYGFAFGAVLGGGLGALSRVHPHAPAVAHASDLVDEAVRREAQLVVSHAGDIDTPTFQRKPSRPGADANYPAEASLLDSEPATHPVFRKEEVTVKGVDDIEVARVVKEYTSNLEAKGKMEFRGRQGAAARKGIEDAAAQTKADVGEIRDLLTRERAELVSEHGAPRNSSEHTKLEFLLQKLDDKYKPVLNAAQRKLDDLTDRLRASKESRNARKELDEFKAKTPEGQAKHLFPEGLPRFFERVDRHVFVADEVGAELDISEAAEAAARLDELDPMEEAGEMFDLLTGEAVPSAKSKSASGSSEPVPSLANKEADRLKADERKAKVDALRVRSTTGLTTPEFVKSMIERAKRKGATSVQWLPFQWMRDRVQGVYTTLDHSENQAFRGLNDILHETGQGQSNQEHTAAAFQHFFLNKIRSAERNRYDVGYLSWAKEQGMGTVQALMDVGNRKALFNTEVYLKVVDPSRSASEGVTLAAEGHRDAMSLALELRKKAGEMGWSDIQDSRAYMPVIFESTAVVHLVSKHGEDLVRGLISKSYQEGKFHLKAKAADKLAEMQIRRSRAHQLSGSQVFKNVVAESERKDFIKDLKEAGVPEEHIMTFLEDQEHAQLLDNISNRAKFSLGLNPITEHQGVRMVDLLYTDTSMLTQNYYRESAGGAALAKMGFKSYEHAHRVVNAAEDVGLRSGANAARNKEEADMIRDTLKLMYGKSLDLDPNGTFAVTSRRLRGIAANRSLGMMGFASFPEAARAITHLGLGTVLRNVPAVAIFRNKSARVGATSMGELSEPVLRGIERQFGYIGDDPWLAPLHIRGDEMLVQDSASKIGRVLDNALAVGGNVNSIASGFRAIQGGLEKIVMRGISEKVVSMAEGKMPFPAQMAGEVGWSPQFLSDLQRFVQDNPKVDNFKGQSISVLNFEKMPEEMLDTLLIGMQRIRGRIVQQNFIGDSSVWMHSSIGKVLTQFKSFSIISVEKQLIHDLRGDKIKAAQTLMWSSLLGYVAYNVRTQLASIGRHDREKFLEDRLNDRAVSVGTFNMMPQVAGLSLAGDFLGTVGLLPDSAMSAPGRAGVRPMSGNNIAPAAGVIADTAKLAHSVTRMLDPTSEGTGVDVLKAGRKLVPLSNALGAGQMLNVLIGAAEKE